MQFVLQHALIHTQWHSPFRLIIYASLRWIFDGIELGYFGGFPNGFFLGGRGGGGRTAGEWLADVEDILIELVVVAPQNMILLLHMLLVAPEVLPADLAVGRPRHSHLHPLSAFAARPLVLILQNLMQPLLEVDPVCFQSALLCFLI
jgi:hypothetical protein